MTSLLPLRLKKDLGAFSYLPKEYQLLWNFSQSVGITIAVYKEFKILLERSYFNFQVRDLMSLFRH